MYKFFIKRILEFTIALLALLILLPIFLTISILVLLKMGTPIFFIQSRPGLNGKTFKMCKFRTMTNKCDKNGNLLEDKDRLSNFGSFLRSTSLDELPTLWNVLCGNMSLVGPRPLLIEYLPLYSMNQARRHEVRPGITGWAQVNGRNAISWNEKFELDTWYVENQTFALDMKIILLTLKKVIKRDGISHNNHVTMEKFKGNT
jgi:lipopolysaccharide/colanic/teichoic acid biosynthesis glycosyltransferase